MNRILSKINSHTILRIGISLVFIWFGIQQLLYSDAWTIFLPDWIVPLSHISAITIVKLNGLAEVILGSALLFGICTRISSLLLALHMASITFTVGYDAIGVRDFGLTIATISIFLNGRDTVNK
jgi:uncharacterized membrane protein YphA (DoxX/SURF4 family)